MEINSNTFQYTEQEFKFKVIEKLATIEEKVKHIHDKIPTCEKEELKRDISHHKRLIYILLVTYVPLLITFLSMAIK